MVAFLFFLVQRIEPIEYGTGKAHAEAIGLRYPRFDTRVARFEAIRG